MYWKGWEGKGGGLRRGKKEEREGGQESGERGEKLERKKKGERRKIN